MLRIKIQIQYLPLWICAILQGLLIFLSLNAFLSAIAQKAQAGASQKEINVKYTLKNVIVFLNGAELQNSAEINLSKGRSKLIFSNISPNIDDKSINASFSNNVKILSISHETNFLEKMKQYKVLKDSLEYFTVELEKVENELSIYEEEKDLLIVNKTRIGRNGGVLATELLNAANLFRSKFKELNSKILELSIKERKAIENKENMKRQLVSKTSLNNPHVHEIMILVEAEAPVKTKVELRYLVTEAGWTPKYDIRCNNIAGPIEFEYRAQVYNNSGIDWQYVNLVLSTADPTTYLDKPTLEPWGLSFSRGRRTGKVYKGITGGEEGYLDMKQMELNVFDTVQIIRGVEVAYSEIEVSELSVDFSIKEKYTIPSDKKPYLVDVNSYKLNAGYEFYTIPKVESKAFLLAKIVGWESLNLVEGPANIYYNNTYIGQSYINTQYSSDTLDISLGRNNKILITRVKKQDLSSKKLIGTHRKETFTYEIDIRNTHSKSINIEVVDQVPIAQDEQIDVVILEISGAVHDDVSGKLTWKIDVKPSETKKLVISFTVKYPRNRVVFIRKSRKVACPRFF